MKPSIIATLLTASSLFFTPVSISAEMPIDKVISTEKKGAQSERININDATLAQLTSVPGLGKSKAKAILKYIDEQGKITKIEQLKSIKGIGKKTLMRITEKFELGQ